MSDQPKPYEAPQVEEVPCDSDVLAAASMVTGN